MMHEEMLEESWRKGKQGGRREGGRREGGGREEGGREQAVLCSVAYFLSLSLSLSLSIDFTCREMLDYLFIKNDLEVDWAPPTHHITVSMRNGTRTTPDLDLPTQHFAGCQLEIRPVAMDTRREKEGENV